MKLQYEVSVLALKDLEGIYQYTVEVWSISQANRYYRLITSEIDRICKYPEIGKSIEFVKPNHRILQVKSHLIVYKILNDHLYVDRILHESMDIEAQLK